MSVLDAIRSRIGTGTPDSPAYECKGCGSPFEIQRQVCPECGGYSIERIEW